MEPQPNPPGPFGALVRLFLARFFENEITASTDDMKGMLFWLLAALVVPGLFIPWLMSFDWQLVAAFDGPQVLRESSRSEKVFYLGFAMVATGLLTAVVWSSLLPERRDALILGVLPVSPRSVVTAKLAALGAYILLVAVSMHVLSAVLFGTMLAAGSGGLFALRGIVAHFLAASGASAAVALSVAAAQGLAMFLVGPRLFGRVSTVLQTAIVGLLVVGLAALPVITFSVVHTLRGTGSRTRPWILSTPPVWFLGLYEWLLGTSDAILRGLAARAGLLLAIAGALTVATYVFAYRRQMRIAVESDGGKEGPVVAKLARALLIAAAGSDPEARAAADFYTATIFRVERHRFVLVVGLAFAVTWSLVGWTALDPAATPAAGWLSLPLSALIFLVAGMRLAASLPGDVRSVWLFGLAEPSRAQARRALERVMFLLGVVPPVALSLPAYWLAWGDRVALFHGAVLLALGVIVVEVLIWNCDGMPCGEPWRVAAANLGFRWPAYVTAFFVVTIAIPRLEVLVVQDGTLAASFVTVLAAVAVATRHASSTHLIVRGGDTHDPVDGILRLS